MSAAGAEDDPHAPDVDWTEALRRLEMTPAQRVLLAECQSSHEDLLKDLVLSGPGSRLV